MAWRENPRCDAGDEDDVAEEIDNEGVRVFFPKPTCFIYKQNLMGLSKLKVQIHLWAFIFFPEQKIRQR
jgi:hypothetical protein